MTSREQSGARTPGGARKQIVAESEQKQIESGPASPTKVRDKTGAPLSSNSNFKHQGVWIRPSAIEPAISERCVWDSSVFFVDPECEYEDSDMNRAVLSFCYLDHINEDILTRYLPNLEQDATEQGLDHSPRLASPLGQGSNFSDGTPHTGTFNGEKDDIGDLKVANLEVKTDADCDAGELPSAEPSTMVGPSTEHEPFSSVMTGDVEEPASLFSAVFAGTDVLDSRELDISDLPPPPSDSALADSSALQESSTSFTCGPRRSSGAKFEAASVEGIASNMTGSPFAKPSAIDAEVQANAGLVWPHAVNVTPKASSTNRSHALRSVDSIPDQRLMLTSSDDLSDNLTWVPERADTRKSTLWYAKNPSKRPSQRPVQKDSCVSGAAIQALYSEGAAKVRCSGRSVPSVRRPARARGTPRVRPPLESSLFGYGENNGTSLGTSPSPQRGPPKAGKRKQHKDASREGESKDEIEALLEGFHDPGCEEASAAAAMFLSARVHTKEKPGGGVDRGSCSSPNTHSTCGAYRTFRNEPNEVCPFGGKMSSAVELRCGHKFSLEHLQEAQKKAGFSDPSGHALICPLCGDQHRYLLDQSEDSSSLPVPQAPQLRCPPPTKRCLSIYSSCTDAYMGDLRQDWRRPLGLPKQMQQLFLTGGKDAVAGMGFR